MSDSQGLNKIIPVNKRFRAFMEELERITGKDRLELCSEPEMLEFVKSGFKYYGDIKFLNYLCISTLHKAKKYSRGNLCH